MQQSAVTWTGLYLISGVMLSSAPGLSAVMTSSPALSFACMLAGRLLSFKRALRPGSHGGEARLQASLQSSLSLTRPRLVITSVNKEDVIIHRWSARVEFSFIYVPGSLQAKRTPAGVETETKTKS